MIPQNKTKIKHKNTVPAKLLPSLTTSGQARKEGKIHLRIEEMSHWVRTMIHSGQFSIPNSSKRRCSLGRSCKPDHFLFHSADSPQDPPGLQQRYWGIHSCVFHIILWISCPWICLILLWTCLQNLLWPQINCLLHKNISFILGFNQVLPKFSVGDLLQPNSSSSSVTSAGILCAFSNSTTAFMNNQVQNWIQSLRCVHSF